MAEKSSATRRIFWLIGILFVLVIVVGIVLNATGVVGSSESGIQVETADVEIRRVT
ncbi:MAG: efflux RND transporter periplasmic adaptor subunit, partial [Rhodothermales bacterium]|nr:efflux RND transporter periplasmic adaptor subunit [Rhodothermales bacterium]